MIARAAGLNTFAGTNRTTYLLRTAATEVASATYHGSSTRSTITTSTAVPTDTPANAQPLMRNRRRARHGRGWPPATGIENVLPAFVIPRRARGAVGKTQCLDHFVVPPRMADPHRPGFPARIASPQKQVAARIDGKIAKRSQF